MAFRPVKVLRRALQAMARGPFLTLTGTTTIFVAVLIMGAFAAALAPRLAAAIGLATPLTRAAVLPGALLAGLVGGGAAIGLCASALALARFLRRL